MEKVLDEEFPAEEHNVLTEDTLYNIDDRIDHDKLPDDVREKVLNKDPSEPPMDPSSLLIEEPVKNDIQAAIDAGVENLLFEQQKNESSGKVHHIVCPSTPSQKEVPPVEPALSKSIKESTPVASKLDFAISGTMSLQMNFSLHGEVITLSISASEGLQIVMPGGMKLSLPMDSMKKAS